MHRAGGYAQQFDQELVAKHPHDEHGGSLALQHSTNFHEASLDLIHEFERSFQLLLRVMAECGETVQNGPSVQASGARGASTQVSQRFEEVPHLRIIRGSDNLF